MKHSQPGNDDSFYTGIPKEFPPQLVDIARERCEAAHRQ
jgi:hypothetical protein